MKPLTHAFEIGYGPSFEVLDHSELFPDGMGAPGTPGFVHLFQRVKAKLSNDQLRRVEQMVELFGRVQEWAARTAARETYWIGGVEYELNWKRVGTRAGVFWILAGGKIGSVSLLACRNDESDVSDPKDQEMALQFAFMDAVNRFVDMDVPDDGWRKLRLVTMTRRPLLASMFWPPYSPTEDSVVRTTQLQIAYAFFHLHGELS